MQVLEVSQQIDRWAKKDLIYFFLLLIISRVLLLLLPPPPLLLQLTTCHDCGRQGLGANVNEVFFCSQASGNSTVSRCVLVCLSICPTTRRTTFTTFTMHSLNNEQKKKRKHFVCLKSLICAFYLKVVFSFFRVFQTLDFPLFEGSYFCKVCNMIASGLGIQRASFS